jgi:hypothetical protein
MAAGHQQGRAHSPCDIAPSLALADTFIQKTKKMYADTRTQRNLSKMNEDLADVQKIMTQNIHDVLGRGERIECAPSRDPRPLRRALPPVGRTELAARAAAAVQRS